MRSIILLSLLFLSFFELSAQAIKLESIHNNRIFKLSDSQKNSMAPEDFFQTYRSELGLSIDDQMHISKEYVDRFQYTRKKYHQTHQGLDVIGSGFTMHYDGKNLIKASGNIYPNIMVDVDARLDMHTAKSIAARSLEIALVTNEHIEFDDKVNWEVVYEKMCVIDKSYPKASGEYALAYAMKVSTQDYEIPIDNVVYIDAHTGGLINYFTNIKCGSSKGKARTRYYGEVDITTDSLAPDRFLLRDFTRGKGVITLDYNTDQDTFEDSDNYWDNFNDDLDEIAGDAHYCTSKYYDMMLEYFDWDGLDNEGGELISIVHSRGRYFVNAYWNGVTTNYGNGDCHRYGPLTTMTVVGHEFAHGWTDETSDLIYRNESGALNESISDIMGKALEYYADKENFTWNIGDHLRLNEDVNVFRSMSDPTERNDPKFYNGLHWYSGLGDNGGVHSNSGVFNYWFYLLVEGVSGTNEKGIDFNVQKIGMRDALEIVFGTQTAYLTQNSTYFDCMYYSLEVAKEFYGENSTQHIAVLEAWKAVGLYPGIDDIDLSLEIVDDSYPVCPGESFPITALIRNVGNETYDKQFINLNFDDRINPDLNERIELTQELYAGDSIYHTLTVAEVNENSNGSFEVSLIDVDENTLNNSVSVPVDYSDIEGVELELIDFSILNTGNCADESFNRFRYTIRNHGCKVVPAGEFYIFNIQSDAGDFVLQRNIIRDNNPGDYQGGSGLLSAEEIPSDLSDFEVSLNIANDIDETNNTLDRTAVLVDIIEEGYREFFNEQDLEGVEFNLDFNDAFIDDTLYMFRSNQMLGFTRIPRTLTFDDCEEPIGFFEGYDIKSDIQFCIDASDMDAPIFEFNTVAFINESRELELPNPDFGVMMGVETDSMEFPITFDFKEGIIEKQRFELTPNYRGPLTIEFILESAHIGRDHLLNNTDALLFDEFKLYDASDYNPTYDAYGYLVSPNPGSNLISIQNQNENVEFGLKMFDTSGRLVKDIDRFYNYNYLDVSDLSDGVYFMTFFENGTIRTTQRFVIMK